MTCLDGREFIKTVAYESWHKPFSALVGPVMGKRQLEREARRLRNKTKTEGSNPPVAVTESVSNSATASTSSNQQLSPRRRVDRFVMNLPGAALEFLDAFRGCLSPIKDELGFETEYAEMPFVHCHCFTRELDPDKAKLDIQTVRLPKFDTFYPFAHQTTVHSQ